MIKNIHLLIASVFLYSFSAFSQTTGMNISGSQPQNVSNIKGVSIYMPGYQNQNSPMVGQNTNNLQNNAPQMTVDSIKQQNPEVLQKNMSVAEPAKQIQEINPQVSINTAQPQVSSVISKPAENNKSEDKIVSISDWNQSTLNEFEVQGKKNDQKKYRAFLLGK